ncbi:MAG: RNHCP domain-containing protein [Chloroflexota bacterium]
MTPRPAAFGDFRCTQCGGLVSSARVVSGVRHRNHCPYCLWSRHLDLYAAGDRLSACKAPMQPLALTLKHRRDKYGRGRGELMLVHRCRECEAVSINRIAADDDARTLLGIFHASAALPARERDLLRENGIQPLGPGDLPQVQLRLFGQEAPVRLTLSA